MNDALRCISRPRINETFCGICTYLNFYTLNFILPYQADFTLCLNTQRVNKKGKAASATLGKATWYLLKFLNSSCLLKQQEFINADIICFPAHRPRSKLWWFIMALSLFINLVAKTTLIPLFHCVPDKIPGIGLSRFIEKTPRLNFILILLLPFLIKQKRKIRLIRQKCHKCDSPSIFYI